MDRKVHDHEQVAVVDVQLWTLAAARDVIECQRVKPELVA
jgi:hypothetical protein